MRKLNVEEMSLVAGGTCSKETPASKNSASKCNNGLGNGDQGAPGNSYSNNQAENDANGPNPHQSGFAVVANEC
jgi:hypothetical protein